MSRKKLYADAGEQRRAKRKRARDRQATERRLANDAATDRERLAVEQSRDARELYREEKAKRDARMAVLLDASKAAYRRLLEDLAVAQKGGRPRKDGQPIKRRAPGITVRGRDKRDLLRESRS